MVSERSQAASSCSVPITLMSCMLRSDMPGPGRRTIWLCTTTSTSSWGISVAITWSRRSASMKCVPSIGSAGGRMSSPATWSTSGSACSRRASAEPM